MNTPNPNLEPPVTRFKAQVHLGLFAPHDGICLVVTLGLCAFALVDGIGNGITLRTVASLLLATLSTLMWVVVLAYRCLVFLLDTQAAIHLLPDAAARIAVGFWEGRTKP